MRRRWIGLTGRIASGKDYLFSQLWARDSSFERVSFADTLRHEIEETLGLSYSIEKPYSELERRLQQWWGTDYRRAQDPDYWVRQTVETKAIPYVEAGLSPVFTDVRFPNEAFAVLEHGGIIVRVTAPTEVREKRNGGPLPDHGSETAMDDYTVDYTLDSTVDDETYQQQVQDILALSNPHRTPVVF